MIIAIYHLITCARGIIVKYTTALIWNIREGGWKGRGGEGRGVEGRGDPLFDCASQHDHVYYKVAKCNRLVSYQDTLPPFRRLIILHFGKRSSNI